MAKLDRDYILSQIFDKLSIKESELLRPIVPVEQWVRDEYYVGKDGLKLYPFWRNVIKDIFESGQQYNQIVIDGGLGSGKSTCGVFIMLRKLYELSCYRNIQGKFHLMDSALIVFLYFSLAKFQAKRTGFKQFKDTVDSIPYFIEHFPRDIKANDELRFPSNVYYLYGTGTGDAIGSNMLCSLIDEGNFFGDSSGDGTDYKEVARLHRSLVARQESRFLRDGKNESLSIVISSNTFKSSYTEELRKRSLSDPTIKCYRARLWDIKPKGTYSDQYFYVFCGTEKVDPFIIESPMDLISKLNLSLNPNQTIKEAIAKLPNELRTLVDEVPIDFKNQYIVNIVKALQDFSGFSVESTNTFFNNRNVFNSCIDDSIPSLFTKTEFVIETQNDSPQNSVMFYLSGRQFPNPDKPRFLHVDLGLSTDACGIACCYKSGVKMVDGVEHPTYAFDFSIRIVPPPAPKKISIARTEEFLIYLRDKLHLTIGMISWDQFQCLHEDTLIYTTKGNIPIKEVKVGDFVINDSGECRVNNVFHYKDADLIKITTKRGKELLGTPNHRIRISRKWNYSKVWGGHTWSPQKFKVRQTPIWEWVCLSDIKQGDIIDTDYMVYDSGNHIFEDLQKERDIAYLVGYYLGNGTLGTNKGNGVYFTTGTEEYADKIKNLLDTYFVGHNNKIYKKEQPTTGYSVQAPYKEISDFFYSLGFCKERSDTKIIPDLIKGLSNNFLLGLLCGYIDADGTTVNHQINCSSTSMQLLEDFKFILEYRLGLRGFISKVRDACKMEVLGKLCNAKTSYHLGITGNVESLDIGLSLKLVGVRNYRPYFDKVVSVVSYGKSDVYDLSIDKEQAYVANGIYSHNSSSSQQRLQELGFPVRYQSVDRTDKAYLYFSECLYLNCVTFNSQFADDIQHELFNLIHDRKKGKVDHPSDTKHGFFKDRLDAIVGSLYNCLECVPREVCYNDTYSLSFYNSESSVPFTEDSAWLFDQDTRSEQIKEIIDQEYKNMMKNNL